MRYRKSAETFKAGRRSFEADEHWLEKDFFWYGRIFRNEFENDAAMVLLLCGSYNQRLIFKYLRSPFLETALLIHHGCFWLIDLPPDSGIKGWDLNFDTRDRNIVYFHMFSLAVEVRIIYRLHKYLLSPVFYDIFRSVHWQCTEL